MQGGGEESRAEGANDTSREWPPGVQHLAGHDGLGESLGVVGAAEEALARVIARRANDARRADGVARGDEAPAHHSPQVGAHRRETTAVTRGEIGARRAVAMSLEPPGAPRRAGAVADRDLGVVAHEPPAIHEAPHEIYVLAHAHRLVESVAVRAAPHQHTRPGDEADGGDGRDEAAAGPEVEGTEALFEALAPRRTTGAAYPRSARGHERVAQRVAQSFGDGPRVPQCDVGVNEPEKLPRRHARAVVARVRWTAIVVEATYVDVRPRRVPRVPRRVARPVVHDRDVELTQFVEQRREEVRVVVHRNDDVDLVDVDVAREVGVQESLGDQGSRETTLASAHDSSGAPLLGHGARRTAEAK